MIDHPHPLAAERDPRVRQKYHCVTQLQADSWEYRIKRADEEPNDDDLVAWDDLLVMHDRLKLEHDTWDMKRIRELQECRASHHALLVALRQYGRHLPECAVWPNDGRHHHRTTMVARACTCGLDAALQTAE